MKFELPDSFCSDPRIAALAAALKCSEPQAAGLIIEVLCRCAREQKPDGILEEADGPITSAMLKVGWLDADPLRVRNWPEYIASPLRNNIRKGDPRYAWMQETLEKWAALRHRAAVPDEKPKPPVAKARKADSNGGGVPAGPAPETPRQDDRPEPEQLTLTGEKAKKPPKKLTNQQKIIELFAGLKGLDMSSKESANLIVKANVAAATSIDKLTEGNLEMALLFVEIATETKDEQMREWKLRDGQDHSFQKLAALLPLWSDFKTAWDKRRAATATTKEAVK